MGLLKKLIHIFAAEKEIMYSENKFLIAGLGNVGDKYLNTRHNAGFLCVDALAKEYETEFVDGRYGFTCQFRIKNKTIILLKPTTFMNLSGKAVMHYMEKEKIAPEKLLIIADDVALPFGQVRIRKKGGAGGHNGLQNIIDLLGNSEYARIRIGIGDHFVKGYQSNYVLGQWDETELKYLPEIVKHVSDSCKTYVMSGIDIAMNKFNSREVITNNNENTTNQ